MKKQAQDFPWGEPQDIEVTEDDLQRAQEWAVQTPEQAHEEGFYADEQEAASRRFFQAFTQTRGKGVNPKITSGDPVKISVWRARIMDWDVLVRDIMEEILPFYTKALEAVYPSLQEKAAQDPALAKRLTKLDIFLGKGRYEHEGVKDKLEHRYQEETQKELKRNTSPTKNVVKTFYASLADFPGLQEDYLKRVIKDVYTQYDSSVGSKGFYTGTSRVGGEDRANKLLTFFLMEDPYPFLVSNPVTAEGEPYTPDKLIEDFPEGTSQEEALQGQATNKKTFQQFRKLKIGGVEWYVQNERNPEYNFVSYDRNDVLPRNMAQTKRDLADKVMDLKEQAMVTPNFYLSSNVTSTPDLQGQPGVRLQDLGREGEGEEANIPGSTGSKGWQEGVEERDVTQSPTGGLFYIPEGGLPQPKEEAPARETKRREGPRKFKLSETEGFFKAPTANIKSSIADEALLTVLAQEGADDVWIDDKGNTYDSIDQLLERYERDAIAQIDDVLPTLLAEAIQADLAGGQPIPDEVAPEQPDIEVQDDDIEDSEPDNITQLPVQQEEEQELAPAAAQIKRLVALASELDEQGLTEQANQIDLIVQNVLDNLSQ